MYLFLDWFTISPASLASFSSVKNISFKGFGVLVMITKTQICYSKKNFQNCFIMIAFPSTLSPFFAAVFDTYCEHHERTKINLNCSEKFSSHSVVNTYVLYFEDRPLNVLKGNAVF
jgi:hypothetical protein